MKKSQLKILFAAALCIFLASCASTSAKKTATTETKASETIETATPAYINTQTDTYFLTENNAKLLGRALVLDNEIWMPYSSTGAEFKIDAKRLDVTFEGDSGSRRADENNAARVVVFVNGERKLDEQITDSIMTFTIFDQTEAVTGIVQILKVSECANSTAAIKSITLDKDGTFERTADKKLKIEFIGDSITCGYGVDDLNRSNHFKTSTEDNTKTYAYKTAQNLDADYSMVSISGWGIVSGYTGNGAKNGGSILPLYYNRLGFSWGNKFSGWAPQDFEWDFEQFQPDIVVINLGTNDSSYTKGYQDRIDEFKSGYLNFIYDIRLKNPEAHIICTLGIMGQDLCNAIEETIETYKSKTADDKISFVKFNQQSNSDGIAADWHPSEKTHTKAAAKLTDAIHALGF